ncbi:MULTISPECIES: sensor histidine kinase [Streptomyces]|uniref:Signal transduction histidine-protein kinase/phosphatase MprB n=1 Tax=Streptomyces coelicolor (strain ATCC BAA-471 / A3(2) / M145) TaxID=100226 RepID=O86622_STRCO|nr:MULTISPECIES: HAMP domain-containing sensor histidine kinase [Streptomyces]MDX2928614.1 HAMP domain-containing sensor histidine kinase [Streptomyces sp. NRRL_B-16638]MDX3369784.1 HAMP domain-containing sensor histidine kinase [Streptomyces sp. ME02-6987-2C]MDX3398518.1 HAMP domain-containing sensor histidine kinase [Streptomyces sp. ME01-18h]MDX3404677.1 HAMP domain-containing sensor histidine kinase [Streptomyces sp. ME02-6977A]MDX3426897.1 HAMP domain-containing sensor histidine kinase [S
MSGTRHRTRPALTAFLHRLAPRTLRGRLSLVALTTAALLMLILTVAFNAVAQHRLQHQADDELRTRAAAVATTIDTTGTTVRVLETSNDALLDTNVWIYADGRLLEEPPNAGPLTRVADALAGHGGRRCVTAGVDGPLRLCSQPVSGDNSEATVVTALGLSPYRSSADTLLLGSLALDAVMLACTYALTRLAVGRALRPVRTMTDQATQWSAVASEERFGHTRHPSELTRLGTSLDAILDRIRTLLRHERQLTGELSHELRTPLSRIIAELDWWQTRPRTADQTHATHKVIAEAAQSMRTICDTLLDDARGGAPTAPGTAEILPTLRRLTEVLDAPSHLTVTADGPPLEAGVPPALLERIISPLLTNASRYARSKITVHAYRAPDGVRIEVIDDGPGVPPPFAGQLFEPGRRADPGDGHSGAGLGLPLARRLARSAGGEMTYDPDHTPGARFVVSLPAG